MILVLLTSVMFLYLFVSILLVARRLPEYSHINDTISELGERGSPFEKTVAYKIFLSIGVLSFSACGILYLRGLESDLQIALFGLLASVGTGYAVASFFPCDPGSPMYGSTRQQIHNLGGFVEYAGGAFFLFKVSETIPWFSKVAFVVVVCMVVISVTTFWRGLIQRVAEAALFGSIIFLSILLR